MTRLDELNYRPQPDFNRLRSVLLREGKPDYVPFYELFVDLPVAEKLLGHKVADRAGTVEFYYRAGYDYTPVWPTIPPMAVGSLIDSRLGYPITDRASFEAFAWPDPHAVAYDEFDAVRNKLRSGMSMVGLTGGVLEMAEHLCGYQTLCLMLIDDRRLAGDLFERIGALYDVMYRGMARQANVGAIVISDDMGFKTQTLIPPNDLREFVFPIYRRLANIIHEANKPCILHSCGCLDAVMDELIDDIGIDAKHSYQDVVLSADEAKRRYGDRIAILGGFDVDRLCRSNEAEVRAYTDHLLDNLGREGGYALGSGNSIPEYVPLENYLAMLDQALKRRRS